MQAAQLKKYHKQFKLEVNEIAKPTPKDNEVLVRVKYAAVNPLELLIGTGSVRLIQNYQLPVTMGNEFSGKVVAVGKKVTTFHPEEAVYARLPLNHIGAFAEYVAVDQAALALMPANLDFAHAAAVPLTGLTAYQGLHEELNAQPGQRVMIPGGSGSFGQLAIPIAKQMGLEVAVSGNARRRAELLEMGVADYFDYRQDNYWTQLAPVDYVIDTVGKSELEHELTVLKPGGRLLSLRMGPNRQFAISHHLSVWKRLLFTGAGRTLDQKTAKAGVDYRFIFVRSSGTQLTEISKIVTQNNIEPAIEPRTFRLQEINTALALVATGHPQGKVLIKLDDEE
ncbi:NADP-dependent oxidoreductase [Lactiplantibacillus paraplantarum]|uniref:NADP-dependent oxidoreductase n=1 Tax=Lactiplantibacillus paraplantarum TaxID=60520 RepID=UPI003DA5C698